MTFQVRSEQRPAGKLGHTIYLLEEAGGDCAEVCPDLGFNCFRWRALLDGRPLEMLYATPTFLEGDRPTRSGIPVLFPFPNRIQGGRFSWEGKEYRLPLNDSEGKNAIHGFACRRPWRVVDQGADSDSAWVTGEFQGSADAPEARSLWPADYRLRLTCRLGAGRLRLEAVVDNPDEVKLPFGLGYHPYFRLPGTVAADALVQVHADQYWELREQLPTGARLRVDPQRDLRTPRRFGALTLDDVLTGLADASARSGQPLRGRVVDPVSGIALALYPSAAFRELVVFTPPHRQAVCLEPYTCTTDAINLQQRGVDAGLQVLSPGEAWTGVVELNAGRGAGAQL